VRVRDVIVCHPPKVNRIKPSARNSKKKQESYKPDKRVEGETRRSRGLGVVELTHPQ
jgi:hypothetical protein